MKKLFEAQIRDEDNDIVLIKISSYSEEGLMEEMGKSKWSDFAENKNEEI